MTSLYEMGGSISSWVANKAGHPLAQIGVIVFCTAWFVIGGAASENALTLVLSVSAITLTQMVLSQQKRNEAALHLKIDELIYAKQNARDEIAGVEGSTESQIEALRRRVDSATAGASDGGLSGTPPARDATP
jgi:low affinity Fe/Cu permease